MTDIRPERIGGKGTPFDFVCFPTGTNLFDYTQATEMVRFMVEGIAEARAVPEGWKLVPIEPTGKMISAGMRMCYVPVGTYTAMLNAAPEAPSHD